MPELPLTCFQIHQDKCVDQDRKESLQDPSTRRFLLHHFDILRLIGDETFSYISPDEAGQGYWNCYGGFQEVLVLQYRCNRKIE